MKSWITNELRSRFNLLLLDLRSEWGFLALISLCRVLAVIGVATRFWINLPILGADLKLWVKLGLSIYGAFSLGMISLYLIKLERFNSAYSKAGQIVTDTLAVTWFHYLTGDTQSDIYLLYFIPLVLSAHYLSRLLAILVTLGVGGIYSAMIYILQASYGAYPPLLTIRVLLPRVSILLAGAWVYRIQRGIERVQEQRDETPEDLRRTLKQILSDLKAVVPYDSTSLQLLNGGRLEIVTCQGFENPQAVMKLAFPSDDPNYPNFKVIKTRDYAIEDPTRYPHFQDPTFHGTKIRTWLGVPLISPRSNTLLGMISIDSHQPNAYTPEDAGRAKRFAQIVAARLEQARLGSAALRLANANGEYQDTARLLFDELQGLLVPMEEDELRDKIVEIGARVFGAEDCSLYYLRESQSANGEKNFVLHLVASSAIPPDIFPLHECKVSGEPGTGFTGYAVWANKTINLGANEYREHKCYAGAFSGHLRFLKSQKSKQVLITPLKSGVMDSRALGALKIENKQMWYTHDRFPVQEERLFEIFATIIATALERARSRSFAVRQRHSIHHALGVLSSHVIIPLAGVNSGKRKLTHIGKAARYIETLLRRALLDYLDVPTLESAGFMAALEQYVKAYEEFDARIQGKVHFDIPSRLSLPCNVSRAFYHIACEALFNAFCHAGVAECPDGRIDVKLKHNANGYEMMIQDNGRGFDAEAQWHDKTTLGLHNMKGEARSINGDVDIVSKPGEGCTVIVKWSRLS